MRQYLDLIHRILDEGRTRGDRTGTGTVGVFGYQMRFSLRDGFPLVTTKKLFTRGIVEELLWMLRGETHVRPLQAAGVKIWDEWATAEQCKKFDREPGDLGPVYGHQWRNFGATEQVLYTDPLQRSWDANGVDQIRWVVDEIKRNPNSRRLIVSAWNPREATQVALPPCHTLFQFYVQDGELSCQLYQRSGDVMLGVPFNIASYALLTSMIAHVTGLRVGEFVHTLGDAHIYQNHLEQAQEQLTREPRPLPRLVLDPRVDDLFKFNAGDIAFVGYDPHPTIKMAVSV